MTLLRFAFTFFFLSSKIDDSFSFSTLKASQLINSSTQRSSPPYSASALNVGFASYNDASEDLVFDTGGDSVYLMNMAQTCVNSDSCSLEDAQTHLDDILHQQKECIGAGVLSTKAAICDNIDITVDLVANLREKIEFQRRRRALVKPTIHAFNVLVGIYIVSTILHGLAAIPNVPVDSPLFTDYSLFDEAADRGIISILPQEWYWAIRDGYLPRLMTEWMKNGGLVVDTSTFDTKAVAIAPQEWIWSIQNGSFGHILEENMKYGGFFADSSLDTTETVPMTNQDILLSIRDGYIGDAAKHFFRNGGL